MPSNRPSRQDSIIEVLSSPVPGQIKRSKAKPRAAVRQAVIEISDSDDDAPAPPKRRKTSVELQLEKDIKKLKQENEAKKAEIALLRAAATQNPGPSNNDLISEVEDSVTCEICTLKMWTPYILECGHTFCHCCLEDWFNTTLNQHLVAHPNYNVNSQLGIDMIAAYAGHPQYTHLLGATPHPPYTCPTCREPVRKPPTEDFNLKKVVRAVAAVQGEASPRKTEAGSSRKKGKAKGKAPAAVKDPWSRFFRKRT